MWLIASGFLIHVVFLASIFDAYFKTPITPVTTQHKSRSENLPANRLVLFVADGLRAQTLYDYSFKNPNPISDKVSAEYLKGIINNNAPWGISYTQVPTESRPGHIAIIAGFYEDPSAITRGWKYNPVDFDSVLNQTTEAWCWGAPDILNIFSEDDNHVHLQSYHDNEINFGSNYTQVLDNWVFDRVHNFFERAYPGTTLYEKLHQNKIMIFLHLLGIDTVGHSKKPESQFYLDNVRNVDAQIGSLVHVIENYYERDGKTAYIFTSDHGMTNWGSHGAGDPTEIDCPLIAWGSGISDYSKKNIVRERVDVQQADISVLMSILLGINIPMNSVGVLPDKYLNLTDLEIAEAFLANLEAALTQYKTKQRDTEKLHWLKSYGPLQGELLENKLANIHSLLKLRKYTHAINETKVLIHIVLDGVKFYHNFYQTPILVTVSLSVMLWIFILMECILRENVEQFDFKKNDNVNPYDALDSWKSYFNCIYQNVVFAIIAVSTFLTSLIIYVFNIPKMCYLYFMLPQILVLFLSITKKTWFDTYVYLRKQNSSENRNVMFTLLYYFILLELTIQVFFMRWILSILIIGVTLWTYYSTKPVFTNKLRYFWAITSLLMAIFPLLPVIGKNANIGYLVVGGISWLIAGIYIVYFNIKESTSSLLLRTVILSLFQVVLIAIAVIISYMVRSGIVNQNFETETHFVSWLISIFSVLIPFCSTNQMLTRLGQITIGLSVPYILMSVTYEPIFLLILCIHLYTWLQIEYGLVSVRDVKARFTKPDFHIENHDNFMLNSECFDQPQVISKRILCGHDFRRAFCYMFYLLFSFFGTGNIASINSFDPMWIVCFVSVFNPFLMTFLILSKLFFVFIIVSCFFRAVNIVVSGSFRKLLFIILVYCDFLVIHFLFYVKNVGSWLEIGMSISNFVIVEVIVIFVLMLYYAAYFYTTFSTKSVRNFVRRWSRIRNSQEN